MKIDSKELEETMNDLLNDHKITLQKAIHHLQYSY